MYVVVVYSTLSITEGFLDIILYWMPFYYPLKLTFVLYLYLPQTMGASTVYSKVNAAYDV
jgi:receptor expression-enhancing protein 5/6